MSRKKIKLNYQENYDFLMLGISSSEKEHKLIWSINTQTKMNLSRSTDHMVFHKKTGEEQLFSSFVYTDEYSYNHFRMISNRSENGYLIEELKNIDYFLIIESESEQDIEEEFVKNLRQIENVQAVFKISPENLKNKERLIT